MKNEVEYKFLEKTDIPKLVKLFEHVYGKSFSAVFLNWLYFKNPLQEYPYNIIAVYNEEIIGHTAFIKKSFIYNEKEYFGGLTAGTSVLPSFGGYFVPLYKKLITAVKDHFDFLYGFPNKNSYPFFIKLFGYEDLKSELYEREPKVFSESDYQILHSYVREYSILKNIEFLKWRVLSNPKYKYYYFSYKDIIIIWKFYNIDKVDIIYFYLGDETLGLEKKDIPFDTALINILSVNNDNKFLSEIGFTLKDNTNNFIFKNCGNNKKLRNIIFSMLDIDIY